MPQTYIGTSGFSNQSFYPDDVVYAKRLTYYAQYFNSVEINSSFYHVPRVTTLQKWLASVPSDFVFAFKVFRGLTQKQTLPLNVEFLDRWFAGFEIFASQPARHVMLFQYAASVTLHLELLTELLAKLPKTFLYAFEFRHQSWFMPEVYQLLKKYRATLVLSDSPIKVSGERTWPLVNEVTSDFAFLRFHGSHQMYASSYSDQELRDYQQLINQKKAQQMNVFAYFNNDIWGHATENAQTLQKLLKVTQFS